MNEKLFASSVDMEKLMPNQLRRALVRRFTENAREIGDVAVVLASVPGEQEGNLVSSLFVLTDIEDKYVPKLQTMVHWTVAEVCPSIDCYGVLGEVNVLGPEELMQLRESRDAQLQPVVCLADYSPDGSLREWVRTQNGKLN